MCRSSIESSRFFAYRILTFFVSEILIIRWYIYIREIELDQENNGSYVKWLFFRVRSNGNVRVIQTYDLINEKCTLGRKKVNYVRMI